MRASRIGSSAEHMFTQNYTVLYMDDQQPPRVYEGSVENDIWKLWRNVSQFRQRFTAEVNHDQDIISEN